MAVVNFTGITKLPLSVDRVLDGARDLTEVVVLGWDENGELFISMSEPSLDRALMLLAVAQREIVNEVAG